MNKKIAVAGAGYVGLSIATLNGKEAYKDVQLNFHKQPSPQCFMGKKCF